MPKYRDNPFSPCQTQMDSVKNQKSDKVVRKSEVTKKSRFFGGIRRNSEITEYSRMCS